MMASRDFDNSVFCQPGSFTPPPNSAKNTAIWLCGTESLSANTQQYRHRQLRDVGGPVVVLPHHFSELVENCGKRCGSGHHFENLPVGVCIMLSAIAAPTWLMPRCVSGYQADRA